MEKGAVSLEATWLSILPPLIAIGFALLTREVVLSLLLGILSGTFILSGFSVTQALENMFTTVYKQVADPEWNIPNLSFLLLLGGLTALVTTSGGTEAFGRWAISKVKTRVGAQMVTFLTGCVIFIDDYFNALAVGQIARPITDRHGVSRAKLAYLIDSTAAPICVIVPLSSWGAYILSLLVEPLKTYGVAADPLTAFVLMIPMNFYAILALILLVLTVWWRMDLKPMHRFEQEAIQKVKEADEDEEQKESEGKVMDLVLPILVLIVSTVFFILYTGGFFKGGVGIMEALGETNAVLSLAYAGVLSIVFTALLYIPRKRIAANQFVPTLFKGMESMLIAVVILILAWSIGDIVGQLETGPYLATIVESGLATWLVPAVIFFLSGVMAFATGTSWGTFAIMIPIGSAVVGSVQPEWVLPAIAAVLAGAVFGDHCSPISDTTILSSAGAECNHIDHVQTQLPYAILAAVVALIGYLVFGLTSSIWIGLVVSIVLLVAIVWMMRNKFSDVSNVSDNVPQQKRV